MSAFVHTSLFMLLSIGAIMHGAARTVGSAQISDSDCVTGRVTVTEGETTVLHCLKMHTEVRAGWRYTGKLPKDEALVSVRLKEPPYRAYVLEFSKLRSLDLSSSYDITIVQISGETIRGVWEGYFGGPGSATSKLKGIPSGVPTRPHWEAFAYFLTGTTDEKSAFSIRLEDVRHIDFIQKERGAEKVANLTTMR